MEWIILAVTILLYIASCYVSYSEGIKNSNYYYPVGFVLGTLLTGLWYYVITIIPTKEKIYFYSLCWDLSMIGVFYLMPIIALGVKLNKMSMFGLGLIIVGLVIFKLSGSDH